MKSLTKIAALAIAAISTLLQTGCQNPAQTGPQTDLQSIDLAGSEWGFGALDETDGRAFIAFKQGGKVIGHAGCNRFFTSFIQEGERLTFGPIGSTKMACQGPAMATEKAIFETLRATHSANASHLLLILRAKDGTGLAELNRRDWD